MSNALQSSENGGIVDESFLVNPNPAYEDRFNIPTNLAATTFSSRNFFNVKLSTGNRYVDKHFLFRQQYDFGKTDSIVNDSSVVKYFLPKLRFENTWQLSGYNYNYLDVQASGAPDFYKENYQYITCNFNYTKIDNYDDLLDAFIFSFKTLLYLNSGYNLKANDVKLILN